MKPKNMRISLDDGLMIVNELNTDTKERVIRDMVNIPSGKKYKGNYLWSYIEDLCIYYCFGKVPIEHIQRRLKRSEESIKTRYKKKGYYRREGRVKKIPKGTKITGNREGYMWSDEELDFIKATYGILLRKDMLKYLDRNEKAVNQKINDLGLVIKKYEVHKGGKEDRFFRNQDKVIYLLRDTYDLTVLEAKTLINKVMLGDYKILV